MAEFENVCRTPFCIVMANVNDRDFAPLNLATVRGLNDKLYEKRKVAALEVERYNLKSVYSVTYIS